MDDNFEKYLQNYMVKNKAFSIVSADTITNKRVDVTMMGSGKFNNMLNLSSNTFLENDNLMMAKIDGSNYIIGFSPYRTSSDIKEITD